MKSTDLLDNEYPVFYHPYISAIGNVELLKELKKSKEAFSKFLAEIPHDKKNFAYAEGKWTIAEVLVHIIDAERVFQYRALRLGRKDSTSLPGFDENMYTRNGE